MENMMEKTCYCGWLLHPFIKLNGLLWRRYCYLTLKKITVEHISFVKPWYVELWYEKNGFTREAIRVDDDLKTIIIPKEPVKPGVWFCSNHCKEQFEKDLSMNNLKVNEVKTCYCNSDIIRNWKKYGKFGEITLCSEECTALLLYKTIAKLKENGVKVEDWYFKGFYFEINTNNKKITINDITL